jgi:prepilin-type N-terminal cleavage/methylation domain-containing protein
MRNRNFRTLKGLGQRQAGYTLVELAISVSIISLLIVASLTGVQSLLAANKVNRTLTQTTLATANISKLSASTGNTNLNTVNLRNLGAWETSAIRTTGAAPNLTTTIETPFAGIIEVAVNNEKVGTFAIGSGYWYRMSLVPESVCAALATSLASTAPGIYISPVAAVGNANIVKTPIKDKVEPGYKVPGSADNIVNLGLACAAGAGTDGFVEIALFIPN